MNKVFENITEVMAWLEHLKVNPIYCKWPDLSIMYYHFQQIKVHNYFSVERQNTSTVHPAVY
jgi:hypothetical protein